jgi:hypothetical protein
MEMSFRKIVNKEQDLAGKWRVWVEIADGEILMLKFQENPTITKIQAEIDKIIELKEKENGTSNS